MVNVIVIGVIGLTIGCAAGYIYKARRKGIKCIGCPDAPKCGGNCAGCKGSCGE